LTTLWDTPWCAFGLFGGDDFAPGHTDPPMTLRIGGCGLSESIPRQ
jgi:hypothetical protein